MPSMGSKTHAVVPTDPMEWRPQVARSTNRPAPIQDPIVEPFWSGTRVILHFHAEPLRVSFIDRIGDDVTDAVPKVESEIARAILAFDAVIDGVLTPQATRGSEGAAVIHDAHITPTSIFFARDPGIDVERPGALPKDPILAFVAVDLLRIDGQTLLDLPLLERKRLLEAAIAPSERVRVSPFTRPPADPWVASWKGAGLKGALLKAANGRYVPGSSASDWIVISRIHQHR